MYLLALLAALQSPSSLSLSILSVSFFALPPFSAHLCCQTPCRGEQVGKRGSRKIMRYALFCLLPGLGWESLQSQNHQLL
uniref:Putative secreted protein n=1 Tax=Anopheles darlingi TaxID=43151 RepID=A0A2M4D2J0_ANODA